jgi:hypothetical protein
MKINPRIENGEPVCNKECGFYDQTYNYSTCPTCFPEVVDGDPCVLGLRQQRDEARREVCETKADVTNTFGGCQGPEYITPKKIALARDWGCYDEN